MSDVTTIDDVKPYKENILVYPVPLDQERVLPSGILLPENQLEFHDKPRWGVVIAIGSEVNEVVPGDNVLIREGAGLEMSFQDGFDGEIRKYLFVKEEHILMTFDNNTDEQ